MRRGKLGGMTEWEVDGGKVTRGEIREEKVGVLQGIGEGKVGVVRENWRWESKGDEGR